ncbi:acyltransferase family protein [Pedobacter deserti]|uniref:acyltransferase family protein n=1 Tax=Pedobacter deserti TaxID=2817382 RepID=UPI002108DFE4|nr:acyltransferase [Pedobacter sp. SYSU D00382]
MTEVAGTASKLKARYDFLDLLKGGTIILVVLFHINTELTRYVVTPFFMQLFFMISGIFVSTKVDFVKYLISKINRLIVPLLFFFILNYAAIYFASDIVGLGKSGKMQRFEMLSLLELFDGTEDFTYAGALWFLIGLFNLFVFYYFISKISSPIIRLGTCFILSGLGYLLGEMHVNLPYFIDSSISMMFFFGAGHYLKNFKWFLNSTKYDLWLGIILLVPYTIIIVTNRISAEVMLNSYQGEHILLLVSALTGVFGVFFVGKVIISIPSINFLGRNSLIVLCTHQLLIIITSFVTGRVVLINGPWVDFIKLGIVLISEVPIIFFLNKYLPYFVGKRDLFHFN